MIACERSVAAGQGETAVTTLLAVSAAIHLQGPLVLAARLAVRVLEMDALSSSLRAAAAASPTA